MLTPEQLEDVARKLCKIRGIDPDLKHSFTEADVDSSGALHLTERAIAEWEYKAEEIRAHLEVQQAIQSAISQTTCAEGNRLGLHRIRDGAYLPCLPDCDVANCDVL